VGSVSGSCRWLCGGLALALGFTGCRCGSERPDPEGSRDAATNPAADSRPDQVVAIDFIRESSACAVLHRGVLLDLGSESSEGRFDYSTDPRADVQAIDREGATWARAMGRSLSQRFVLDRDSPLFVQVRIRSGTARSFTVMLDDKALGSLRLPRNDSAVLSTPVTADAVAAGPHDVRLQFHGTRKGLAAADVDWIRVGIPDEDTTTFAAPTRRDLFVDAAINGHPRRSHLVRFGARCRFPSEPYFARSLALRGAVKAKPRSWCTNRDGHRRSSKPPRWAASPRLRWRSTCRLIASQGK